MRVNDQERDPDVRFEFGHQTDAPSQARKALRPLFQDDGDPIAEAVMLSASELVSNVILHTDDGGTMQAWDPKPDIPFRLQVDDHRHGVELQPHEAADPIGGRGLGIVAALADRWGVEATADGKCVWAAFSRPAAGEASSTPETLGNT